MTFDVATYNSITTDIEKWFTKMEYQINTGIPLTETDALDQPYVLIMIPLQRLIKTVATKLIEAAQWIWDKIKEVYHGIRSPYEMYTRSNEWAAIRAIATTAQSTIDPNNLEANRTWKGAAQLSYLKTCTSQSGAAKSLGDISDKARSAMMDCAGGGFAFYVGILAITGGFILGLLRAIGELASGVGAGVSIVDIAATAGLSSAQLWAAVVALTTFLGSQYKAYGDVNSTLSDNGAFPNGAWPAS